MNKGSSSGSSKVSRCIKAPAWVLRSVRDLYVKGMTVCAGQVGQYSGAGVSYPSFAELTCDSRFSYSSRPPHDLDKDDLRQIIRAASRSEEGSTPDVSRSRSSRSVAVVGRIDEDRPCEFEEDVRVGSSLLFPRSSSHGAGIKRRRGSNVLA